MKYLKLTQPIYVGYTGTVGRYAFVDGVSVEAIPENERIRIAGNIKCVEVDADGNEGADPSPAASVIANQRTRAELRSLSRQTEGEKAEENVRAVMGSEKPKSLYSRAALDAVASKAGIAGLREIAADWQVKSKSIPVLMQMIIDAQAGYITDQRAALAEKGVPAEEIERLLVLSDEVAPAQVEAKMVRVVQAAKIPAASTADAVIELNKAAVTGDLAAALNAVKPDEVDHVDAVADADQSDMADASGETKDAGAEATEADASDPAKADEPADEQPGSDESSEALSQE